MLRIKSGSHIVSAFFLDIAKAFFIGGFVGIFFRPIDNIASYLLTVVAGCIMALLYLSLAIRYGGKKE